jgi:hypothetical protein
MFTLARRALSRLDVSHPVVTGASRAPLCAAVERERVPTAMVALEAPLIPRPMRPTVPYVQRTR